MISFDPEIRELVCGSKTTYPTRREARKVAAHATAKKGARYTAYRCPINQWHYHVARPLSIEMMRRVAAELRGLPLPVGGDES